MRYHRDLPGEDGALHDMPIDSRATWPRRFSVGSALAFIILGNTTCATAQSAPLPTAGETPQPIRRPIEELKVSMTLHLGKTADWVAVTDAAIWVGSTGPNAVHAVDPATNQRIATVVLPGEPCAGLAVGSDSLWVPLCGRAGGLARIDLKTRALVATYKVGRIAAEGGITAGAGSVWMVLRSHSLVRVDPSTGMVRPIVRLPAGSYNPYFSEGRVWVTRAKGAEVTSVDTTTGTVVARVPTGPHPRFLTAGDGAIWTLNQGDGSLSRVNVTSEKAAQTIALGTPGPGGDITFGAGRIWTTFSKVPLSIIDASAAALLCQWTGPGGDSLGVSRDAIWLTNYKAGTVSRIALADIPSDCGIKLRQTDKIP
jgi:virginiamycin B lyase